MAISMNTFHCPNGHEFEANAKLRARCPECGASTKRGFETKLPVVDKTEPIVETKVEPRVPDRDEVKPESKLKLVRQGRPRIMAAKHKAPAKTPAKPKKPGIIGNKASGGLVAKKRITTVGARPQITRKPLKTAVARTIKTREVATPYWHGVAQKYGL
jgi:hypothetical protein